MLKVLLIAGRNGLIPHFKIQLLHNQKEQKTKFWTDNYRLSNRNKQQYLALLQHFELLIID